jgi:hypothetical protein
MNQPDTCHPGRYWHALPDGRLQCDVCPRYCKLHESQRGLCFVRARQNDQIVLTTYGRSSGFCIDPIGEYLFKKQKICRLTATKATKIQSHEMDSASYRPPNRRTFRTILSGHVQFTSAVNFSRLEVLLLGSAMLKVPSSSLPLPGTLLPG